MTSRGPISDVCPPGIPGSDIDPRRLRFPSDIEGWLARERQRRSWLHKVRERFSVSAAPSIVFTGGDRADIVVSIWSRNSSSMAALMAPVAHLRSLSVGIISDRPWSDVDGLTSREVRPISGGQLPDDDARPFAVLVPGVTGVTDEIAISAARRSGGRTFVVQHGLLTPFSPPLPHDCTLFAWSAQDGEFWKSGRGDVEVEVVGSQLLWNAAQAPTVDVDPSTTPTFLGQLHGTELAPGEVARVSYEFCRATGARYRPHPAEIDRLSRLRHRVWKRRGIAFDNRAIPLHEMATPIVATFSTGILEAAAAGRPAWGFHPDPPPWVAATWERYGINRWGGEPTPPPTLPVVEPAVRIAEILTEAAST